MRKDLQRLIASVLYDGPMGVTRISKLIDVPASTIHRFLSSQDYFKQTEDKKWKLPEEDIGDVDSLWPFEQINQIVHLDDPESIKALLEKTDLDSLKLYIQVEKLLTTYARLLDHRASFIRARGKMIVDDAYNSE